MKRRTTAIAAVLMMSEPLLAEPPSTRPTTTVEPAGQVLDRMLGGPKPDRGLPASGAASGKAVNSATTRPGVAPGSPAAPLIREGTVLQNRVGRIARSADGSQVEFVFDADGQALSEPPVIILPNQWLYTMEQAAATVNRDLRFRITGMVTEYRSRNYVLLDKVVVVQDTDGRF
jgi:hypothetical protein